ncbi:MAG: TIM-barrel domain-containing protein [Prolixibacteraceae bacterium]
MLKYLKIFFFLLWIVFLVSACNSKKEKFQNEHAEYYKQLNKQLSADDFSPLELASGAKAKPMPLQWKQNKNTIQLQCGIKKINIGMQPIQIELQGKKSNYVYHVYTVEGVQIIDHLYAPVEKNQNLYFSTSVNGVTMKLIVIEHGLQWQLYSDKISIDSIKIITQAQGPFYGGGERFVSTCLDGRTISNQPNDHYFIIERGKLIKEDLTSYEPSYLQVPFVLNPHGQAWYFDDAESMLLSFDKAGSSFSTIVKNNQVVMYAFTGESPKAVLSDYTALTGRQPELPDWALGLWINILDGQDSVFAKATRLKEWGIPATAIWLFDMDDPNTSTGWPYWTRGIYTDYRKITDSIHALGFKALTYLRPYGYKDLLYYKFDNPIYAQMDSLGVLLHSQHDLPYPRYRTFIPDGQYDFYNPAMADVWKNILSELLVDDNFDGWMEDFGDVAYSYDILEDLWKPMDFGIDYPISDNIYANAYPLVYHKLSYQLTSDIKPDVATFCRSGSAGSAAYTRLLWGGDQLGSWDKTIGYPTLVSAGISCGLSGYSNWTPDILCDSPSIELWKRWVQFGAFTPLMRDHLWANRETSVDLWTNKETRDYFKLYAEIHMKLLPYIQASLEHYRKTGTPLLRHMMLEFPNDAETFHCEYQYMFGDKYLVAPVVEEGDLSKRVYFPKGQWKSFWNNTIVISIGEWKEVAAPLDEIPVFERLKQKKEA